MRSSTPPWPGITADASFIPTLRFSRRLEQIADDADGGNGESENDARRQSHLRQPPMADYREAERGADEPADRALDGLLRAHDRRKKTAAERAAAVVLKRVADGDGQDQQQRRFPAERPARGREQAQRNADVERRKRRDRRGLQRAAAGRRISSRSTAPALRGPASYPRPRPRPACPACRRRRTTSATAARRQGARRARRRVRRSRAYSRNASSATSTAMPSRKIGGRNHSAATTATSRTAPLMRLAII